MSFCNNKQKALLELIELLNKGIDLLSNDNLDKDLYNAFEKYVQSTIKLVDAAYMTTYELSFFNNYDPLSSYRYNPFSGGNSLFSNMFPHSSTIPINYGIPSADIAQNWGINNGKNYKNEIKILLQRLISILKFLATKD
ncbi:MAG: hypothetical protein V8R11_02265 [Alphaproteobacteria bacterium]